MAPPGLRELVTGQDGCAPSTSQAGQGSSSNAAASLADALLGRKSKYAEQASEVRVGMVFVFDCSEVFDMRRIVKMQLARIQQGGKYSAGGEPSGMPSLLNSDQYQRRGMAGRMVDPEYAAKRAMDAPLPGTVEDAMAREFLQQQGVAYSEFGGNMDLKGKGPAVPSSGQETAVLYPQEFEHVFQDSRRAREMGFVEHPGAVEALPYLQAFLRGDEGMLSSMINRGGGAEMQVVDKCRVRDRSTILARQVFVDRGHHFADAHVDSLLRSLHIDPGSLPASVTQQPSWDQIYNGTGSAAGLYVEDFVQQQKPKTDQGWIDEFSDIQLSSDNKKSNAWAGEFGNKSDTWADEYGSEKQSAGVSALDREGVESSSALEHTKRLAETLGSEKDPKFKNSKFLQFVSKMSRGELIMEGNQVREVPVALSDWAEEFEQHKGTEAAPRTWGDEYGSLHENNNLDKYFDSRANGRDWADEFANQMSAGGVWAEEFGEGKFANESSIANWEEEYFSELEKIHNPISGINSNGAYLMSENNPFLTEPDSFLKGRELFRQGLLSEAVLAIEAECQRNPGNVEAWRLLGTVQAENDDDTQAIAALNQALACDPDNLEVLFSLGVSYTNELAEKQALEHLRAWLIKHPVHGRSASYDQGPLDSSQNMSYTIQMFEQAAAAAPDDADVHAALGVLCNLGRRYSDAVASFRKALSLKSNDYSLWNKLGATLANSAQSGEALDAYRRALEAKPNYMRAWANMGISLANLGEYEDSSRYYIRALALNQNAGSVWGYLRTSLLCAGRDDLLELVEKEDLAALQQALPL